MATLTSLRSVGTNLTLTCPFPKSFVCNLPDSGRHVTSVYQGLCLSRSMGRRVGENPGNEVSLLSPLNIRKSEELNQERYSSETAVLLKNLEQSHTLLSKTKENTYEGNTNHRAPVQKLTYLKKKLNGLHQRLENDLD